ncbi:MAG: hypothetical protein ABEH43_07765, partial [Flavobacteriales bacterium]
MDHLITGHTRGVSLYMDFATDGSKQWHKVYHDPTWGIGYYYKDLSNQYLGSTHGIYLYTSLPL